MNAVFRLRSLRPSLTKASQTKVTTSVSRSFQTLRTYAFEPTNAVGSTNIVTSNAAHRASPSDTDSVNILSAIGKPLLIAVAGGALLLATEDVISVGWEGTNWLEKKDNGVAVTVLGRKMVMAREEGKWAGRVE